MRRRRTAARPRRHSEPKHARRKGPQHARRPVPKAIRSTRAAKRGRDAAAPEPAEAPATPTAGAGPEAGEAEASTGEASTGEHRLRRRARSLWGLLATVAAVTVLFVGVFPTRTFLAQRSAIARAEDQLATITAENERLNDRADALNTPDEVERIAREEFELIRPGERPFVVLEPGEPAVQLPAAWPFTGLAGSLSRQR